MSATLLLLGHLNFQSVHFHLAAVGEVKQGTLQRMVHCLEAPITGFGLLTPLPPPPMVTHLWWISDRLKRQVPLDAKVISCQDNSQNNSELQFFRGSSPTVDIKKKQQPFSDSEFIETPAISKLGWLTKLPWGKPVYLRCAGYQLGI